MAIEVTRDIVDEILGLYKQKYDPMVFNFNALFGPHIYDVVPPPVVEYVHQYIIDPANSGNTAKKVYHIDEVLYPYGLRRFASGTNRAVYKYLEDQTFCVKTSFDDVGIKDNPAEFINQEYLKPFVSKIFSTSPCGTMATCERVIPIRSRQEFASIAGDVFDVSANVFLGRPYLVEDFGTAWFKNWGIRRGFGPVLVDFPHLFSASLPDLYCTNMTPLGLPCGGGLDYDTGFNIIYCTRCGKRHLSKQIGKALEQKTISFKGGGSMNGLHIIAMQGDKIVADRIGVDNHIDPLEVLKSKNNRR